MPVLTFCQEIIQFPKMSQISHLDCRRVRESDITFNSHMSGFVYNVTVKGRTLIKKEIPGPETIDEFLYEVNALATLHSSNSVVRLYAVVVDDYGDEVKGLLIEYAEQGALNDILYDNCREQNDGILWSKRQKWARQIVQGLADIHESGFVQGDFTMSNIVVTAKGNAKIIDINRRGCPLGWEPPEATALIKTHHRMTLYIGVKSDLYQLGMVLWGLAMLDDEPESHGRPLVLGPEVQVPDWYRQVTEICLSTDPRMRLQASTLLHMFPPDDTQDSSPDDDTWSVGGYSVDDFTHRQPYIIRTVEPSDRWESTGRAYIDPGSEFDREIFPMRGRSPPSPLTSDGDEGALPNRYLSSTSWAANNSVRPSFSDVAEDDATLEDSEAEVASEAKVSFYPEKQEVTSAILPEADTATQEHRLEQAAALAANRRRSLGDGLQMLSTPKLSRKPTAIRNPPPGASRHGDSESEKFGTSEGGLPADAVTTRIGDMQDTRTTESEGEGGVSLQLNDEAMNHKKTMPRNRTAELTRLIKLPNDTKGCTFNSDCVRPVFDELSLNPRSMAQDYMKGAMDPRMAGSMLDDYALLDARLSETFDMNENRKHPRRTGTFERQLSLPLSLAGIGAGLHSGRDAGIGDETDADADYYALTRPATMPAMTFTTDT